MDAVVTAGGRIQGEFAAREQVAIKALLMLEGKTLLERTLEAIRGSGAAERVCVVGPRELEGLARRSGADLFVAERQTGIDNLLAGIEALQARGQVICSASDLPFLRPADVEQVVARTPAEASLSYVAITRQEWESVFPDSPNTLFVPLADGRFTGGCLHVQDADTLRAIEPLAQRAFAARKSQLGMARLLGLGLVLRLLCGHLVSPRLAPSTSALCRRIEGLAGCPRAAVVRGCSPRVAADVDSPEDWRYVCQVAGRLAEAVASCPGGSGPGAPGG